MVMRWLIVPTFVIAAAVPLRDCGTVKVDGPKTKECPEGRYIVTADQTVSPPLVSYRCEKPVTPESPKPSEPPTTTTTTTMPPPPPSAPPTPKPSATPTAPPSGPIPVQLHVCPANYPRKPELVHVGRNARRAPANPFAWLINLSPIVSADKGLCADENGGTRSFPGYPGMCEQWGACATQGLHDDANTLSSWEPAVYAEGPGFSWDHVESRSRPADPAEPPCPSDNRFCYINYYLKNLVLGDGGSGPGHYFLCAAVTEAEVKDRAHIASTAECADFQLTLP